jgi:hypothetical protein
MKNLLKLSALAAVLVASATYASADTLLASGEAGTTTSYDGYSAGVVAGHNNDITPSFLGGDFASSSATPTGTPTMAIGTGGVGGWIGPITGTSWITGTSLGNTSPGGVVVANGYYEFSTTFSGAGFSSAVLSVLADDTVGVFLNGAEIVDPGGVGTDGHCGVAVPNCNSIDTFNITSSTLGFLSGTNELIFLVEQTGSSAMGLDFSLVSPVTTSAVPEPSTLLMLGTGLLGSAGAMFRRMRRS